MLTGGHPKLGRYELDHVELLENKRRPTGAGKRGSGEPSVRGRSFLRGECPFAGSNNAGSAGRLGDDLGDG